MEEEGAHDNPSPPPERRVDESRGELNDAPVEAEADEDGRETGDTSAIDTDSAAAAAAARGDGSAARSTSGAAGRTDAVSVMIDLAGECAAAVHNAVEAGLAASTPKSSAAGAAAGRQA
jgi:hypothetical protein